MVEVRTAISIPAKRLPKAAGAKGVYAEADEGKTPCWSLGIISV